MQNRKAEEEIWGDLDWGEVSVESEIIEREPPSGEVRDEPAAGEATPSADGVGEKAQQRKVDESAPAVEVPRSERQVEPPPAPGEDALSRSPSSDAAPSSQAVPDRHFCDDRTVAHQVGEAEAGRDRVFITPESIATLRMSTNGRNTSIPLSDSFQVGRKRENDLVIQDRRVSSHHARFVKRPDGVFVVHDLESAGGTFVNGERVVSQPLSDGDRIEFATVGADFHYVSGEHVKMDEELGATLVEDNDAVRRRYAALTAPKRRARLIAVDADQYVAVPSKGRVAIGRAPHNDFVVDDMHVSNEHARLVDSGNGIYEIFDLGSTCGTAVNGESIVQKVLSNGDRIQLGSMEFVFEISDLV